MNRSAEPSPRADAGERPAPGGRGPDTLREISLVREGRRRLPTSVRLSTVMTVLMAMVLASAAVSFYFAARFFGQNLGDELVVSGAVACLFALFASLIFVRVYFAPISRYAEELFGRFQHLTGTLEQRVAERTAALAETNARLRGTLDQNRSMQQQIVDASRRAGMADVATSVLHNVGNVLNSVNVSAAVLAEKVEQSRLNNLAQVATLLREHAADLPGFFTDDERGRKLPAYIATLAQAAEEDRAVILAELASLQRNIDHIKVVVGRQQGQAKAAIGVIESVVLADLLDEALKLAFVPSSHGITIDRQYGELPRARLDRHKLFETLMNLLANARHALQSNLEGKREARIKVVLTPIGDRFTIEIIDNGVGISALDLGRIFSFGFSTKPGGHGFGLHASALAMAEMGGTLTAHSDGPGRGARFRIELPVRAPGSRLDTQSEFSALYTPPPETLR